jgi:hypothetical protein
MNEVIFYRLNDYGALGWQITAADGSLFDYRVECSDNFKELHDRQVKAATDAAQRLGLKIDIPAPYGALDPAATNA